MHLSALRGKNVFRSAVNNNIFIIAGYVPRWPFKFGKTYREECDVCLAEFLAGQTEQKLKQQEVQSMTRSLPSLRPISAADSTLVRDHLNSFTERGVCSSDSRQCSLALSQSCI